MRHRTALARPSTFARRFLKWAADNDRLDVLVKDYYAENLLLFGTESEAVFDTWAINSGVHHLMVDETPSGDNPSDFGTAVIDAVYTIFEKKIQRFENSF